MVCRRSKGTMCKLVAFILFLLISIKHWSSFIDGYDSITNSKTASNNDKLLDALPKSKNVNTDTESTSTNDASIDREPTFPNDSNTETEPRPHKIIERDTKPKPHIDINTDTKQEGSKFSRTSRFRAEQILRDAVQLHHDKLFDKPMNETCEKRVPSCIVIGVQKGGTRELVDFLHLHPHIITYPAHLQKGYEMPYFYNTDFHRGEAWLKSQMPCSYSNQLTLMKHSLYFHNSVVPERIKRFNESIKLILIVREPVARAISHFRFHKRWELENKGASFDRDLGDFSSSVLTKNGSDVVDNSNSLSYSVYDEPMKLWLKYFNLGQFLILESDEFKRDPYSVLTKVEQFLGLGHFITEDMLVFNDKKGFYCIRTSLTETGMACYSQLRGNNKNITVLDSTITKLQKYFKPKNQRFFEMIGKTFHWEYTKAES